MKLKYMFSNISAPSPFNIITKWLICDKFCTWSDSDDYV